MLSDPEVQADPVFVSTPRPDLPPCPRCNAAPEQVTHPEGWVRIGCPRCPWRTEAEYLHGVPTWTTTTPHAQVTQAEVEWRGVAATTMRCGRIKVQRVGRGKARGKLT